LSDKEEDRDMPDVNLPESEGVEPTDATAVVETSLSQRRMALILGLASLITGGIRLWGAGWNTLTALLLSTGVSLVLYWKTGADPKGWGKAIGGKKNAD
jgi:hypothetical protein